MRIVAIGEAMIEMAGTSQPDQFARSFAGDTFNTAWYLARARPDWAIDYVTAVGQDPLSDAFVRFAQGAGIGTGHVQRHPHRTMGLYMIALSNGERAFHYWRDAAAARTLAQDAAPLRSALHRADVVFLSGITAAILPDADRATLLSEISQAKAADARIVFDPNIRPRLWPDLAQMRQALTKMAAVSDIVLPSFEEESLYFGDTTPSDTISRYRNAGANLVVVKNGAGPISFAGSAGEGAVTPEPLAAVVDTTAAGDSFNAGFLAAFFADAPVATSIETGCTLSRGVIQHHGALVA